MQGDTVYTGFSDGFLVALDRETGSEKWQAQVGEGTYPDLIASPLPLPQGGVLVGGYTRPLLRLDPATRSPAWRLEHGSAAAALLDGDVAFHPGADGALRCIDVRTGEVKWTWESGSSGPLLTPQLTGQGLLVASTDDSIYLLDPVTGARRWSLDLGITFTGFAANPAVAGDEVYALSNGGRLYALSGKAPTPARPADPWLGDRD